MKIFKQILSICLIASFVLGTSGCVISKNDKHGVVNKSTVSQLTNYLEKKYNDNFECVDRLGGTFDDDYEEYYFACEKYPNKDIWASISYDGKTILDNYVNVKYDSETNELMDEILTNAVGDCQFFYSKDLNTAHTCVDNGSDKLSFEDFVSQRKACLELNAVIDISNIKFDKEQVKNDIEQSIIDSGACFALCQIYFVSNDYEKMKSSSDAEDRMKIDETYDYFYSAEMDKAGAFTLSEWEE